MSLARNVWADLVERRLWPVAIVLLMALVAIPIALASGGSAPQEPPIALVPADGGASTAAKFTASTAPIVHARPRGARHNPLGPPGAKQQASASSDTPSSASQGSTTTNTTTSSPGVSQPPVTTTPPTTTTLSPTPPTFAAGFRVDVRFGEGSDAETLEDVARLRVFSAGNRDLALLLGVDRTAERALFVLTGRAEHGGDGTCLPLPTDCQVLVLERGDTSTLTFTAKNGSTQRYRLTLSRIALRTASSQAEATEALERESRAGRELLGDLIEAGRLYVGAYSYSKATGAVVPSAEAETDS